jgi:ABC-type lipoprotein export system ATPase subunit
MSDTAPLLAVAGLSRHHDGGAVKALDGVTFDARAGEVVALTGPSGCGKSTLLSLIGLLDQPTSGSVCVAGQNLATVRRPGNFRLRHIGFVFQFHHMVSTMTLLENVEAPLIALGLRRAERRERAADMLERMNLSARAGFLPAKVSGGERQRAAVARALINHPSVILADEPTGNLDSHNNEIVVELLMAHARAQGALVIIATHNPEIARVADRRIELCDGSLVNLEPGFRASPFPARIRASV